jgi:hypothetical protein
LSVSNSHIKAIEKYGLTAVDGSVIRDLFISQAVTEIEKALWQFPIDFVEDYNDWLCGLGQ